MTAEVSAGAVSFGMMITITTSTISVAPEPTGLMDSTLCAAF